MRKICLVGCGTIGKLHAKNLTGEAELYFCSRSEESARAFNETFGGAGVFGSLEEALAREDISGVVIASPPEFHKDQVVASLAVGKGVLVEKPMCVSPGEVEEIGRAVTEANTGFLMVAENYYYKPSLTKIKTLVGRGTIGEVRSVAVKKLSTQVPAGWKTGYGALLEGGIHFVALVNDLVGEDPAEVRAEFPGYRSGPERHSVSTLSYQSGVTAKLEYSWNTPSLLKGTFQHSCIQGEFGKIVFESNGIYVTLSAGFRRRIFFPGFGDLMGYGKMTRDFLRCLDQSEALPYSDFTRAARDLKVVFHAYKGLD
jgi:predicted dehydrogenase